MNLARTSRLSHSAELWANFGRIYELARGARGGGASGGRSLAGGGDRGGNFRESGGAALPGPHGRLQLRPLPAPGESRFGGRLRPMM